MKFSSVIVRGRRDNRAIGHRRSAITNASAFTMVEVAISLAIIGIALVAIIGVLPLGMNAQRDNREATVINQDATIFLQAVRNGARGLDDLTNYVYAITNFWTRFDISGATNSGIDGFSFQGSQITKPISNPPFFPLTNGLRIVGLLSTPQLTDLNFNPTDNLLGGGFSNYVVAFVRSISGPAAEKPPQDNDIVQGDALGYRLYAVNAPVAHYIPPLWVSKVYNVGDQVAYLLSGQTTYSYWLAVSAGQPSKPPQATDVPGVSPRWVRNNYPQEIGANLHDLRLTFRWPVRPNGQLGPGRQIYRALIPGQVERTNCLGQPLYFYQSQSFTNAP